MLNINGVSWRILLVPPTSSTLARSDDSLASGVCDNDTKCIYINENLNSSLMKRVLCHEITHAAMFSYETDLTVEQEQYDQLSEFYRIYSGLGGNGQAKEYYELALELPIKPE